MLITILGSGRLGSTLASYLAAEELADITLLDIVQGLPQGEALDIGQMAAQLGADVELRGSNDYRDMQGSDLVVITAGFTRKPDMTRLDLLEKNAGIIRELSAKVAEYAPSCVLMMVTNPVDVMTYLSLKVTGFDSKRVLGMGGMLDSSRFRFALARKLHVSPLCINALVIGEHGESMLPLPRYSSVSGIPLLELIPLYEANRAVEEARQIAAEVIALKGATVFAPVQAIAKMVEAIARDKEIVYPVSSYLDGEYGVHDVCIGVPVVLGSSGIERIIELELNRGERGIFMKGVRKLQSAINQIEAIGGRRVK